MCMPYGGHPGESVALRDARGAHGLLLLEDARTRSARGSADGTLGTLGFGRRLQLLLEQESRRSARAAWSSAATTTTAARVRLLRSHGMTTLSWDRHRGHASELRRRRARLQLPHRRGALLRSG